MCGMKYLIRILTVASLISISGCTAGAPPAPNGSVQSGSVVIHLSLGKFGGQSQYGPIGGYSPNPLVVTRGSVIQFFNDDNFGHTASSVGTSGFPQNGPGGGALSPSGHDLTTQNWSTGDLPGGTASQTFTASTPGTYFYGCFFHYGFQTPMRGVIIVQ